MIRTVEAVLDAEGRLRMLERVRVDKPRRVLVTILDEEPTDDALSLTLVSEASLAKDWDRPEEDAAWSHLVQLPSL